jgi:2-haloacid dehalogenase
LTKLSTAESPGRKPIGLSAAHERWATFDCYGTLLDWNGGIRAQLERLFGVEPAGELLERYHELEPQVEDEDPSRSYREVLSLTLERLASKEGLSVPEGESDALARSLPNWPVFPEVPPALRQLRQQGWRLCILSNSDRDLIDSSIERIGVPFDDAIVASEIGSYKPNQGHWREFERRRGQVPDVHVAASLFHDVAPANELGVPSVWINRLDEQAGPAQPDRELRDLARLAEVLDELVPA